jgi:hypothetical protein
MCYALAECQSAKKSLVAHQPSSLSAPSAVYAYSALQSRIWESAEYAKGAEQQRRSDPAVKSKVIHCSLRLPALSPAQS